MRVLHAAWCSCRASRIRWKTDPRKGLIGVRVVVTRQMLVCLRTVRTRTNRGVSMKLVVAMTGATGAPLGIRLLEALRETPGVETHLVLSPWARSTISLETDLQVRDVAA